MLRDKLQKPAVHEIKFTISNSKAHQVIRWLKHQCMPDPEFPEGAISSIYYDTRNWRFMAEKDNSDYLKMKIRLRWYSDLTLSKHDDVSFIEAKFKIGNRREKFRMESPFSGEWLAGVPLHSTKLLEISRLLRSQGIITEEVFPVFQISYKRFRFIEPLTRARVCFDYDITAPRVNWSMLPKSNPFSLQTAVFEIKSALDELPAPLYPLTDMGFRKSSFSKYQVCYRKIVGFNF